MRPGTRSTAVREGDDWVLNGAKTFTTNAHYADVCVAMAVTDRAASQHGISAFIIEKDTPGFRVGKKENKLGMRASATGEVIFQDCRVPRIAAARQARTKVSSTACGFSTAAGSRSRRCRSAWRRAPTTRRCAIPSSASSSAGPSPSSRPSSTSWSTWRPDIDAARLLTYRAGWMLKDRRPAGDPRVGDGQAVRLGDGGPRLPTKRCRFTADTDSSRIIRSRSSIAT